MIAFPNAEGLPGVAAALDPSWVLPRLRRELTPRAPGGVAIESLTIGRIRYRPNDRCIVQYRARCRRSSSDPPREAILTATLYADPRRAERLMRTHADAARQAVPPSIEPLPPLSHVPELGMTVSAFPFDRKLPALPSLVGGPQPELATRLLGVSGQERVITDVDLVRYREHLGATLRWRLRCPAQDRERTVFVKIYPEGEAAPAWAQLTENPLHHHVVSVATPVAHLDALDAIIMDEAPGISLEHALRSGNATAAAATVARALAALHQGAPQELPFRGAQHWERSAARAAAILAWALPPLATDAEHIARTVAAVDDEPAVACHGDLKPEHLFVSGARVILVDLDSRCRSTPAADVADLLVRIIASPRFDGVHPRIALGAASAFVNEYRRVTPPSFVATLHLHVARAALDLAASAFRRQLPDWAEHSAWLVHEADAALHEASKARSR